MDVAHRVVKALGNDPTQAFVLLDRKGKPLWASPSIFSLVDLDVGSDDPLANAMHPDDASLCAEIFDVERAGVADTTFDMERRYELLVRVRSPRGGWNVVALRLLNFPDDPEVNGMLLQMTMANQEHSTVQAFDAAAAGVALAEVLALVLQTICSGGTSDSQAVVFDKSGTCIAATSGAGIAPGEHRNGDLWTRISGGRLDLSVVVTGPTTGEEFGVLETVSNFPDVRPFTRATTERVARRVGLMLEADRAREELCRQADTDALTGLLNRRALRRHLARTDLPSWASVAFVDLNGFKLVNDRYGHSIGDVVLVEVAARLRSISGTNDVVCRVGGDEFVIVRLRETAEGLILEASEVEDVVNGDFVVGEVCLSIAATVGVAAGPALELPTLLTQADIAMYSAKDDHGNNARGPRRETFDRNAFAGAER
jgi:diguanylate cyclase (GGDEF)-like protein